jgi:hypothetical protein
MHLTFYAVYGCISYFSMLLCSGTAELFATCAKEDIRVWHTMSSRELLRITVPNMTCHGIDFMRDGKSIISGNVHWPRFGPRLCLWVFKFFY